MTELEQIIIQKIKKEGPISFCKFMEMALYYPRLGYYTSGREVTGRAGDYYTSPVLSNLFGYMIGKQIEEMYALIHEDVFTIVEYGAEQGALCTDILNYLKDNCCVYNNLKYYIIEKNTSVQQKHLNEKVVCLDDINTIAGFNGCIISNELIDNFPVHIVQMKDELLEVFVDYDNGFTEVLLAVGADIKNYLQQLNVDLPKDYRTEINLRAYDWIKDVASALAKGFIITIDYGYSCSELYNVQRNKGTLTCYHHHTINHSPYTNIGMQDITAHVNFSALYNWGKEYGLECTGFCNQNYFLRSLGIAAYLRKLETESTNDNEALLFQVNKLLLEMGDKFHVLVQQKGVTSKSVMGMMFGRQYV
jgi:SAM-dependent MidA family methyltransferase